MADGSEGLDAYQKARALRRRVFKLVDQLPADERDVLKPQMRRAALSMTNNIAEGHGSYNWKYEISYLYRARGSVNELIDNLGA
jgi:four helix bundle protein